MGYTPLLYCFSRMTETSNVFENKSICIKIAEILLHFGSDVNYFHHGKTLLMSFCGITMNLDSVQLEMNLEVVQFLIEHGADKGLKCRTNQLSAVELANNHCASQKIKELMTRTRQVHFHPKPKIDSKGRRDANSIILDDTKVKVGCCSIFSFCRS